MDGGERGRVRLGGGENRVNLEGNEVWFGSEEEPLRTDRKQGNRPTSWGGEEDFHAARFEVSWEERERRKTRR